MSDTSILTAIKYKGQMIEIPEGLTQNDISTFITSNDISTKLEANDVSQFLTANDVSTDQPFHFFTNTTDSTKKGIVVKGGDGYAANIGNNALQLGATSVAAGAMAAAFGHQTHADGDYSFTSGNGVKVYNTNEAGFGKFNNSSTGTDTLFTVGNGLNPGSSNRHNALEIKLNGDVYISDTDDTANANYYKKPMKRLQDLFVLDTSVSQLWDSSTSGGGSADTSNFVTKTELFDEETTTTEPDYAKGDRMFVGKTGHESSSKTFASDSQTSKAYILFENLTEQEDIWSYSYYGDYCYMEITNGNDNSVYGWFVLYKDGSVVMTSENLSVNQISLEYRTSGWPLGLLILVDDSTINTNSYAYNVHFYKCTYTPGETITTCTIKESLLPESSCGGGGISLQYLTQAEYDALQTIDQNTLYLIS